MEIFQQFQGTLNRGFQGNLIYNFHLPDHCTALSVKLTYNKEHFSCKDLYAKTHAKSLIPLCEAYLGRPVSDEDLLKIMDSMKTEIQLCLIVDGKFVGNVHMPGTEKEMVLSRDHVTRGCLPCPRLKGMAKIMINVFQVLEDETDYRLEMKGEFQHVEEN